MNHKFLIILLRLSLLVTACASGNANTPTPEVIPTVIADTAIIAEGRLEPIHYAEIAFSASGEVMAVEASLGIVVMVSILASMLPARSATRISVRDSLAYA